jgi:flavin reductase (DIM6/NTAB) family NADH-FMN oxidoreductase RutF/DNA-binding GntR family transcriptional regulator
MTDTRTTTTGTGGAPSSPVDQNLFRDVIGRFASGVTVISTRLGDADLGTTASAVSSLSMDPPMLLICMNRTSETGQAIMTSGRFVVNILGEDQADIAKHFATKAPDKFASVPSERGLAGLPLITGALGHLECSVAETATGGTHTVFLSHVERAGATDSSPLTYYRGRFGRFEETAQEAAYQQLRRVVMARGSGAGAGQRLDIDELAQEFGLERPRIQYALIKLTADGLVERDPDRGYVVRPLDVRAAREAIQARCLIEMAVAEEVVGTIDEHELAELRRHAEGARRAVAADPPDYELLRSSGRCFHETFMALGGNETLVELYRRLRIDAIWGRLLRGRHLDPDYLMVLADACAAGDAETAKRALRDHADHAARVVEEMIEQAGGEI